MPPHNRPAQEWKIYRDGQLDRTLQVLRIDESAGGQRVDTAELMVDPEVAQKIQDYDALAPLGSTIEIVAAGSNRVTHFGVITQHFPTFSPSGEVIRYVSRCEHDLFGEPSGGVIMFAPGVPKLRAPGWLTQPEGSFVRVDDPIIFNPEIDGRTVGNMHSAIRYGRFRIPVFLHPESVRTEAGRTLHKGTAITWPLTSAVYYLCHVLNAGPIRPITNPTLAELGAVFVDSTDLLRNAQVDDGKMLPEVLDELLLPMGYHWKLAKRRGSRKIEFFRRGSGGSLVYLNHQRFGDVFDPTKTNVETQGVVFDASRLANTIVGRGSKLQLEITAELVRTWPEALDEYSRDQLTEKAIAEDAGDTPGLADAYRKWALNEAGDYIGKRPEIKTIFNQTLVNQLRAGNWLRWMVPRRRKLLPTLTQNAAKTEPIGTTDGVEIEYKGADGEWKPVGGWSIEFLKAEAGIYIKDEAIPEALLDARSGAAMRITATIETDFRITAKAADVLNSSLPFPAVAMLDLDGEFHWRVISSLSKYNGRAGLEADDRPYLQRFVDQLLAKWNQVDVAGNVVLEGVDQHAYSVGDRVAGVKHRNVSFKAKSSGNAYPQIVGLTYDVESQKTIVHLERTREFMAG